MPVAIHHRFARCPALAGIAASSFFKEEAQKIRDRGGRSFRFQGRQSAKGRVSSLVIKVHLIVKIDPTLPLLPLQ